MVHLPQEIVFDAFLQAVVEGRLRFKVNDGKAFHDIVEQETIETPSEIILQAQIHDGSYVTVCKTYSHLEHPKVFAKVIN